MTALGYPNTTFPIIIHTPRTAGAVRRQKEIRLELTERPKERGEKQIPYLRRTRRRKFRENTANQSHRPPRTVLRGLSKPRLGDSEQNRRKCQGTGWERHAVHVGSPQLQSRAGVSKGSEASSQKHKRSESKTYSAVDKLGAGAAAERA